MYGAAHGPKAPKGSIVGGELENIFQYKMMCEVDFFSNQTSTSAAASSSRICWYVD